MQVPVVAYDAAAVGETMGRGGILLKEKDCLLAAGCLNYVASNEDFRKELLNKQNKELKRFRTDYIEKNLLERLNEFIAEGGQGL